jgi:hypothetical protein
MCLQSLHVASLPTRTELATFEHDAVQFRSAVPHKTSISLGEFLVGRWRLELQTR